MITIDYDKVPEKQAELEELKKEYKAKAEEDTKEYKAEVTKHETHLNQLYDYQRCVVELFEALIWSESLQEQLAAATSVGEPNAIENIEKQIEAHNTFIAEVSARLVNLGKEFYPMFNQYLNDAAKTLVQEIKEVRAKCVPPTKEQLEKATQLQYIGSLLAKGEALSYRLWEVSPVKLENLRDKALDNICVLRDAIQTQVWAAQAVWQEKWNEATGDLDSVKDALKQLQKLMTMKEQYEVAMSLPDAKDFKVE